MNNTASCASITEQLNCFTLEAPVYSSFGSSLLIADSTNHVYKFQQKQKNTGSKIQIQSSLQIDDLSNYIPIQPMHKQTQVISTFKMNIDKQITKCECQVIRIDNEELQIILVFSEGKLMLWYRFIDKQSQPEEYDTYKIAELQFLHNIGNISDYYLSNNPITKQKSIDILTIPKIQNQKLVIFIHTYTPEVLLQDQNDIKTKKLILKQKGQRKLIPLDSAQKQQKLEDYPPIKMLNEGRIIALGSYITQINQQFNATLDGVSQIVHFQNGKNYLLYADLINLYLYNKKQLKSQTIQIQDNKDILNVKFVEFDVTFVVTTIIPARADIYNLNKQLLWSVSLAHIQNPLVICNFSRNENKQFILILLDCKKLITHKISKKSLLNSAPRLTFPPEQVKVHQSTITTLKHRMQILKTLQTYIRNEDYNSVFRFLNNCNNNSLLNDGLMLVHHRMSTLPINIGYEGQLMQIANSLLQQSKYQSHIQNSLQILLQSCKRLKNSETNEGKQWQECMKLLKMIIQTKKVRKLQQQQKNKRIFQLSYELLHTANSHLLKIIHF